MATDKIKSEYPEFYEQLRTAQILVETAKIPDFAPLIKEDMPAISSLHDVVHINPLNGKEVLFFSNPFHSFVWKNDEPINCPFPTCTDCTKSGPSSPLKLMCLIEFAKSFALYEHKWAVGDLLLWDNV